MDAGKRPFGEGDVGGRKAPLVDLRQEGRDARTYIGVIFLARNEDEDGDEAIKFVGPRQRPHAGALIERQDLHDEIIERLDINLEEFVARIFFEDMLDGLARMAGRVKAGAL